MTTAATEILPRPRAISAAVTNDVTSRTLIVRCPDTASGYDRLSWRESFAALKRDDEATGWSGLYADAYGVGARLAYALTGHTLGVPPSRDVSSSEIESAFDTLEHVHQS